MAKKSRKGFYIKGEFVTEAPPTGPPSRTAKKKASERLQEIGEALIAARPALVATVPMPERLRDAIGDAKTMKSPGAQRRQRQFIGKLMRALDDEEVDAIRASLQIED